MISFLFFCAIVSPTERYLVSHPIEEVKYSMRLAGATLEQKPIFDKSIKEEKDGFFGYFAASADFRMYQDLIRFIFEEKLGAAIPKEFHFLGVPFYPNRSLHTLQDVYEAYFEKKIPHTLFAFHPALYANHNRRGFSPATHFAAPIPYLHTEDLIWLLQTLEMDPNLLKLAQNITKTYFQNEDRVLLQLFDTSNPPYACIDSFAHPASPSGHPCKNEALSDYLMGITDVWPSQYGLLLNDGAILNPQGPIRIKRYTKIQPTSLKSYEEELRNLVRQSSCNQERCQTYSNQVNAHWRPS